MVGTVTNNVNNITQAESVDSGLWDDIGGGQGSGQNADLPIQGSETRARRIDAAQRGFGFDNASVINITGQHVGFWVNVLQPALIGTFGLELSISDSGTGPQSGNWNGNRITAADYPTVGGWQKFWVDPSRTRDVGSGTLNLANARNFGCNFDLGNVGGTSQNCHLDSIDYSANGLTLSAGTTGSPGTFSDLSSFDSTNALGIIDTTFLNGPIIIGSGVETNFSDENFAFKAGNQPLSATDWIKITLDGTNAATEILMPSGSFTGIQFDFVGTAGLIDLGSVSIVDGGSITLTSAVSWAGSLVASGQINPNLATTNGLTVASSTAASALFFNDTTDPITRMANMSFESAGTGHAIELGTNCPTVITFDGHTYSGYAGVDGVTGNEVLYNNSGKSVTINITGGGNTPTIRNGSGASTVVSNPATLTLTGLQNPSEVRVYDAADGTTALGGTENVTTGTFAAALNVNAVNVVIHALSYLNIYLKDIDMSGGDVSIPIQQRVDRQYENPS